ncbi:MAG: hypothetical protein B7X71_05495 [Polynucleobacter sp. 39-46-10]|nr:MAG: hypothetical protein B7X71_05495 [Polynucleobacter sp. 39-46-10]
MPPRHISPQSFDDILSELGDDPAIPDPHGIRKTSSPPRVDTAPQSRTPKPSFPAKSFELKGITFSPFWIFGGIFLLCGGGSFFYLAVNKSSVEIEIHGLENQLLSLKEELELSQSEWQSEREDLYEAIDEIEVSIHLLNIKPPIQATQAKPIAIPHEAELRRWRYLGIARMGLKEQAFFHTGKTTRMIGNGEPALGEWRLTQVAKEQAILNHSKGKSITFKSTQSE